MDILGSIEDIFTKMDPQIRKGIMLAILILGVLGLTGNPMTDEQRAFLNIYTLYHFILGVGIGVLGLSPRVALVLIVAWEFLEQLLLVPFGIMGPPELIMDSVLDIIVGLIGYGIASVLIAEWRK